MDFQRSETLLTRDHVWVTSEYIFGDYIFNDFNFHWYMSPQHCIYTLNRRNVGEKTVKLNSM